MSGIAKKALGIVLMTYAVGCSNQEQVTPKPSIYTGNEVSYALLSGSEYNVSGIATLKERNDRSTDLIISLKGVSGGSTKFPVHLHLGDISVDQAAVAALLNSVDGKSGISTTNLRQLGDESIVSFDQLKNLNACIKIHLSDIGDGRNVILAAGNIGSAVTQANSSGRLPIGLCKSN